MLSANPLSTKSGTDQLFRSEAAAKSYVCGCLNIEYWAVILTLLAWRDGANRQSCGCTGATRCRLRPAGLRQPRARLLASSVGIRACPKCCVNQPLCPATLIDHFGRPTDDAFTKPIVGQSLPMFRRAQNESAVSVILLKKEEIHCSCRPCRYSCKAWLIIFDKRSLPVEADDSAR